MIIREPNLSPEENAMLDEFEVALGELSAEYATEGPQEEEELFFEFDEENA